MPWNAHWPNLITLFDYPPEIRKVIYTTNAIESLNRALSAKQPGTRKLLCQTLQRDGLARAGRLGN